MSEYVMRAYDRAKISNTLWELANIMCHCETDEEIATARRLKLNEICDSLEILLDELKEREVQSGIFKSEIEYVLTLSE